MAGLGTARHGTFRSGTDQLCSVGSARHGAALLARHGPACRRGSAWLGPVRLGTAHLGPGKTIYARLGSVRHGAARLGTASFSTCPVQKGVSMGTGSLVTSPTSSSRCSVPKVLSMGTASSWLDVVGAKRCLDGNRVFGYVPDIFFDVFGARRCLDRNRVFLAGRVRYKKVSRWEPRLRLRPCHVLDGPLGVRRTLWGQLFHITQGWNEAGEGHKRKNEMKVGKNRPPHLVWSGPKWRRAGSQVG